MKLIFVGGCERSGTSLVQKILTSHSRIAGGPELVFTGRIADLYERMAAHYPAPYATRIEAFYDGDELAAAFRSLYGSFFRKLSEKKKDAIYFSEKTPSNIFAASRLLRIFPDSLFVHVLRDGRDVLASHRDVQKRFEAAGESSYNRASFETRRVCARWNRAAEAYFELEADTDLASRLVLLKYEDLLLNPEQVLRDLFHRLDLDLQSKALAPENITPEQAGVPIDGFWTTEEMYRQAFNPQRIHRWKHALPPATRMLGNLLMATNLDRLSYPVGRAYASASRALQLMRPKPHSRRFSRRESLAK